MSAFVVTTETMTRVLSGILQEEHTFRDIDLRDYQALEALGRDLFALNIEAVRQRYPRDKSPHAVPPVRTGSLRSISRVNAFKAMQCLLYQCSEGNVPETPLYKRLEACCDGLARSIIRDLPEYERCPWDASSIYPEVRK